MSTVLITGANRGIGLALTQQFRARGDEVIAVVRSSSKALEDSGARVESGVDVTSARDVADLAGRLRGVTIDVLLHNAGVMRREDPSDPTANLEEYRLQFEVNSLAPLRLTEVLSDHLGPGARIGIVTSRMGSIADNESGGFFGYRMSKAAVNMAGVCLAHALKERGIAVVLLHPGYVRTEMTGHTGHIDPDESARGLIQRIDELTLETTGSFRHSNGEALDW